MLGIVQKRGHCVRGDIESLVIFPELGIISAVPSDLRVTRAYFKRSVRLLTNAKLRFFTNLSMTGLARM